MSYSPPVKHTARWYTSSFSWSNCKAMSVPLPPHYSFTFSYSYSYSKKCRARESTDPNPNPNPSTSTSTSTNGVVATPSKRFHHYFHTHRRILHRLLVPWVYLVLPCGRASTRSGPGAPYTLSSFPPSRRQLHPKHPQRPRIPWRTRVQFQDTVVCPRPDASRCLRQCLMGSTVPPEVADPVHVGWSPEAESTSGTREH
jgi:hypothetical protein